MQKIQKSINQQKLKKEWKKVVRDLAMNPEKVMALVPTPKRSDQPNNQEQANQYLTISSTSKINKNQDPQTQIVSTKNTKFVSDRDRMYQEPNA